MQSSGGIQTGRSAVPIEEMLLDIDDLRRVDRRKLTTIENPCFREFERDSVFFRLQC